MSSQVFGNLIAALVLGNMNEANYFYIMTVIAISSLCIFGTMRKPNKVTDESLEMGL